MLLARAEDAEAKVIQRLLRTASEDTQLTSSRMIEAVALLTAAMDEPWCFVRVDGDPERPLTDVYYRRYLAILIGEAVPTDLAVLSLQQRLRLYLILVKGLSHEDVQCQLGCTEHGVNRAIEHA